MLYQNRPDLTWTGSFNLDVISATYSPESTIISWDFLWSCVQEVVGSLIPRVPVSEGVHYALWDHAQKINTATDRKQTTALFYVKCGSSWKPSREWEKCSEWMNRNSCWGLTGGFSVGGVTPSQTTVAVTVCNVFLNKFAGILCNSCWLLKIMSRLIGRGLVQPVCLFSPALIFAFKREVCTLNSTFYTHTLHVLICG